METRVERVNADDGIGFAESATIIHEGREYTNLGAVIDWQNGRAFGYVSKGEMPGKFNFTTWEGKIICPLIVTGKARGFGGVELTCYRANIAWADFYGRGQGEGVYLRLRRSKAHGNHK